MTVIADTGPLVALFDRGDEHHEWAKSNLGRITEALLTSESVVGEVLFLLAGMPRSRERFLQFWTEGGLYVVSQAEADKTALIALLRKYADIAMSLADASIVRLSEIHADAKVWSLDSDFKVYRRFGRRVIALLDWPR